MQRTPFNQMNCSIARTINVVGEWWTPLIVRDLALGISRFDALQRNLGISRKVLTQRLSGLIEDGIAERVAYQDRPPRYDYWLTEKGAELALALLPLQAWGDKWEFGGNGPITLTHSTCGHQTRATICCSECGGELNALNLVGEINPESTGPIAPEVPAALKRMAETRAAIEAALAASADPAESN